MRKPKAAPIDPAPAPQIADDSGDQPPDHEHDDAHMQAQDDVGKQLVGLAIGHG